MADANDAQRLRELWNPDSLGRFEGKWIAFKHGEVSDANANLAELSAGYQTDMANGEGPIFAFVTFSALQ